MSFTDSGYGWQFPVDGNSKWAGVAFICRQMIARLDTMKLVRVISVQGGGIAPTGTVTIQPLVSQIDGATPPNPTPHGQISGIPFFRLMGGANAIVCDPQVGDLGYVICADRDSSIVVKTGTAANPGSQRRYNIADGVYVGGCISQANPEQYCAFTAQGIVIADKNGNVVQMTEAGIVLNGVTIDRSGNVSTTGTITDVTGSLTIHVHGGVQTGSSNTGPRVG